MNGPTPEEIKKVMGAFGRLGGQSTSPAKRAAGKRNIAKATRIRVARQRQKKKLRKIA